MKKEGRKKLECILYCGAGFMSNIGNSFIDYGVMHSFNKSGFQKEIRLVSNMSRWIKYNYAKRRYWYPKLWKKRLADSFDIRSEIDADLYVFSGSLLNCEWFVMNSKFIKKLIQSKSKIIIYGGGGNNYSRKEVEDIKGILRELNIYGLVTRDEAAYDNYHDLAEYSYSGIDCGFFLNDCFRSTKLNLSDYIVYTFDSMKEPHVNYKGNILRLHHSPWNVDRIIPILRSKKNIMKNSDLISDLADDYLNIYANCEATYSDRVHACVAALSFGKKAKYFGKSQRSFLFERAGLTNIKDKLSALNWSEIEKDKENQILFLRNLLDYLFKK